MERETRTNLADPKEPDVQASAQCKRVHETPSKTPRKLKKRRGYLCTPKKTSTPLKNSSRDTLHFTDTSNLPAKKIKRRGNLTAITNALVQSKYTAALTHILSRGPSAQRAMRNVVNKAVSKEVQRYVKLEGHYPRLDGITSVSNFSWIDLLENFQIEMPLISSVLSGMMPSKLRTKEDRLMFVLISVILLKMQNMIYVIIQYSIHLQMCTYAVAMK